MMHEYAKEIKQEPSENRIAPFTVRRFKTLAEVYECIQQYEEETVSHFIKYNKDKKFGDEEFIPNIEHGRIHYWSHTGKTGCPIEYDGIPFMHIGRWVLMCHQGYDVNKRHKEKYQMRKHMDQEQSGIATKSRNRSQVTKKVGCPAEIYVTHVIKFPQQKVPNALLAINSVPTDHMRKLAKKRIIASYKRNPSRFSRESWYYVRLPDISAHEGHPVLGQVKQEMIFNSTPSDSNIEVAASGQETVNAINVIKRKGRIKASKFRTKEPVDPRVLQKMYELTRQGVTTVSMMQNSVREYVREELFPDSEPPPSMYRRYNPTASDIQNAMYKVKQEMRLEGKSILQYRCAALVREITELVVQTDSEDYLNQLEEQLRNIYSAVRNTVPVTQVTFRSEGEGEQTGSVKRTIGDLESLSPLLLESPVLKQPRLKTSSKHQEQQNELDTATYHLKLEHQQLHNAPTTDAALEVAEQHQVILSEDGAEIYEETQNGHILEHHQVHEIIQQDDGTITEVYYYQPMEQYGEDYEHQEHGTIIIQPGTLDRIEK